MKNGLYYAHLLSHENGKVVRRPAGRFAVKDGSLHHLEDYHGLLEKEVPEGMVDDYIEHKVKNPGPDLSIASHADIVSGSRLDFVPEHPLKNMVPIQNEALGFKKQDKPHVWHYTRAGYDRPHLLESKEGKFALDGNPLNDQEVKTMLQNVKAGVAKVRYPKAPTALAKAEAAFDLLRKAEPEDDMGPDEALAHLNSLHDGDPQSLRAMASVRRHLFTDPLTGLGNKLAYTQFRNKAKPGGVTVMGDANNLKATNDTYGHDVGDQFISAFGKAWKDSAAEVGDSKSHRFGGDELHAHFPSLEHAHSFARALRSRLEAIPPVNGTHNISMSIGIGPDAATADGALYQAKKKKAGHTPSSIPHLLTHSHFDNAPIPQSALASELPVPALPSNTK